MKKISYCLFGLFMMVMGIKGVFAAEWPLNCLVPNEGDDGKHYETDCYKKGLLSSKFDVREIDNGDFDVTITVKSGDGSCLNRDFPFNSIRVSVSDENANIFPNDLPDDIGYYDEGTKEFDRLSFLTKSWTKDNKIINYYNSAHDCWPKKCDGNLCAVAYCPTPMVEIGCRKALKINFKAHLEPGLESTIEFNLNTDFFKNKNGDILVPSGTEIESPYLTSFIHTNSVVLKSSPKRAPENDNNNNNNNNNNNPEIVENPNTLDSTTKYFAIGLVSFVFMCVLLKPSKKRRKA